MVSKQKQQINTEDKETKIKKTSKTKTSAKSTSTKTTAKVKKSTPVKKTAIVDVAEVAVINDVVSPVVETTKVETEIFENKDIKCKGIFCVWIETYKNMFNFKGRSSRYELWSFVLLNYIICTLITSTYYFTVAEKGNNLFFLSDNVLLNTLVVLFMAIQITTYLSLSIRRLHDTNSTAWKKNYRPVVMTAALWFVASVSTGIFVNTPSVSNITLLAILISGALYILLSIVYLFYITRMCLKIAFVEEDVLENVYGLPKFIEKEFKDKALRYATIYIVLVILIVCTFWITSLIAASMAGGLASL